MAVKAQWSFDHLPNGLGIGTSSIVALGIAGATFNYGTDPGGSAVNRASISNGSLSFASLYSSYYVGGQNLGTWMTLPLNAVQDLSTPHSVIGFRVTIPTIYLGNMAWLTTGSTNLVLVNPTDAALGMTNTASTYYVEIVFDRPNNQFFTYVNNKLKKTTFYDPTTLNSTTTLSIGTNGAGGNGSMGGGGYVYRDFLFIDDTQDNTPCVRQGPGTARPMTLLTASASGWTSSDSSTPLADLTTPIATNLAVTPNITSPVSQTPIQATFQTAADPNLKVVAASVVVSSSNPSANNGNLNGAWSLNGQTVQAGKVNYPDNTMQWSKPVGLNSLAPDGSAWTIAKLLAATFSATPSGT